MKKYFPLLLLTICFILANGQKVVRLNYFNYPVNANFEGLTINVDKQYETKNMTVYVYTLINEATLNPNDSMIGYFTLNNDTVYRYRCRINNIMNVGDTLETGCVLSVKTANFKEGNNTLCLRFHTLYKNGVPYNITEESCCPTFIAQTSNVISDETTSKANIYPNPTKDYLVIENCSNSEINLYNISGQSIINTKISTSQSTIDVSHLSEGIYFLKVTNNNTTTTRKINIKK